MDGVWFMRHLHSNGESFSVWVTTSHTKQKANFYIAMLLQTLKIFEKPEKRNKGQTLKNKIQEHITFASWNLLLCWVCLKFPFRLRGDLVVNGVRQKDFLGGEREGRERRRVWRGDPLRARFLVTHWKKEKGLITFPLLLRFSNSLTNLRY